ncbi:MAG: hypothetical protein GY952_14090 [Rhodobacteraceae bacterium]|nr:hypothetical protein [Paracoccaceae bacterium]
MKTSQPIVIGDSLAGQIGGHYYKFSQGGSGHTNDTTNGHTIVGAGPARVYRIAESAVARSTMLERMRTRGVVLSTGLANNPTAIVSARTTIHLFEAKGIHCWVLGVAWGVLGFKKINRELEELVGSRFVPLVGINRDRIHMSATGVKYAVKQIETPIEEPAPAKETWWELLVKILRIVFRTK